MTFEKFKELVTLLYNENKIRREFVDSIPAQIQTALFDNDYVISLGRDNDTLIEELFGDLSEDVFYFLYECNDCKDKTKPNIFVNETSYAVYDLDSYFDYAEKELF